MRYILLIPDGASDHPHAIYAGKTALESARLPNFDRIAQEGTLGLTATIPPGLPPGSDVANMSLLGYDPTKYYTGRAPFEAAAQGVTLAENEAVYRMNLVRLDGNIMANYAGDHISSADSRPLVTWLNENLHIPGVRLIPGVQYRHLCTVQDSADAISPRIPPHDLSGQSVTNKGFSGRHADKLQAIEKRIAELLSQAEWNIKQREKNCPEINAVWLWGGGTTPALKNFSEIYGVSGAMITAVDLLRGIAKFAGLEIIEVDGATGYLDTNYQGKAQAASQVLKRLPFVVIHIEAPDEAGHEGKGKEKMQALEDIDHYILQPLLDLADKEKDIRILTLPDHPTPIALKTHVTEPVPFVLWGCGIDHNGGKAFHEAAAKQAWNSTPLSALQLMPMLFQR